MTKVSRKPRDVKYSIHGAETSSNYEQTKQIMELVIQLAHYPREITLKDEVAFITLDLNNIFLRFHSLRLRLFTFVVHKNALYEAFMCVFYGWSKRA